MSLLQPARESWTAAAVSGGGLESLAEGCNAELANRIHHFALWKRTYNPALSWVRSTTCTMEFFGDVDAAEVMGGIVAR
jgi:hypothetical protein